MHSPESTKYFARKLGVFNYSAYLCRKNGQECTKGYVTIAMIIIFKIKIFRKIFG